MTNFRGDDILTKKAKQVVTELSERDKKILDKYTKFPAHFIESNTTENHVLKNENFERRK